LIRQGKADYCNRRRPAGQRAVFHTYCPVHQESGQRLRRCQEPWWYTAHRVVSQLQSNDTVVAFPDDAFKLGEDAEGDQVLQRSWMAVAEQVV